MLCQFNLSWGFLIWCPDLKGALCHTECWAFWVGVIWCFVGCGGCFVVLFGFMYSFSSGFGGWGAFGVVLGVVDSE